MSVKLSEKAMLVKLNVSQWTARKHDRGVSEKVAADYGTSQDAGRYNKVLIAQDAIKAIQKVANEARTFHYENTLPWNDNGARILPAANFMGYSEKMRGFRGTFETAVSEFINNYPALVDQARIELNGMFKSSDYPMPGEIHGKYGFSVSIDPLPDQDDFRVTLQGDAIDTIKADIQARTAAAEKTAMADLWRRLYDNVKHMADRLNDKDAIFRDSLVNNLVDLCELLPRLNISGDPALEKMRLEVEARLCTTTPAALRENQAERENTAKQAADIMSTMAGYMG